MYLKKKAYLKNQQQSNESPKIKEEFAASLSLVQMVLPEREVSFQLPVRRMLGFILFYF